MEKSLLIFTGTLVIGGIAHYLGTNIAIACVGGWAFAANFND